MFFTMLFAILTVLLVRQISAASEIVVCKDKKFIEHNGLSYIVDYPSLKAYNIDNNKWIIETHRISGESWFNIY
jgi:hypothetical protein